MIQSYKIKCLLLTLLFPILNFAQGDFSADTTKKCLIVGGATIKFTYSGANSSYFKWDFGDGNTSIVPNPAWTYINTGTFTVKLETQFDTIIKQNYIAIGSISANFGVDTLLGCAPLTVQFTDSSMSSTLITKWHWDFGDGDFDSVQNPSHIFKSDGQYSVILVVQDDLWCNAVEILDSITVGRPSGLILANKTQVCNNELISFTAVKPSGTYVLNYIWDFGDGLIDSSQAFPFHSYSSVGVYNVSLIMRLDSGCDSRIFKKDFITVTKPVANFTANDPDLFCAPRYVLFTDSSKSYIGTIVSRSWDFGNGNTSGLQNPSTTYLTNGKFDVTLSVIDNLGCKDTIIKKEYINIIGPIAKYSVDKTSDCIPAIINFLDSSVGATVYKWTFGDGAFSDVKSPTYTYPTPGNYRTFLEVLQIIGNDTCLTQALPIFIDAYGLPNANFLPESTESCDSMTLQFYENSVIDSLPIVSWLWNFGDGSIDSIKNPIHFFGTPGVFDVSMEVTNDKGCSKTITRDGAVKIIICTDVMEEKENEIFIFPYPNEYGKYFASIKDEKFNLLRIEIYDILGRKITKPLIFNKLDRNNLFEINLKNFNEGIYIMKVQIDDKIFSKTIIK